MQSRASKRPRGAARVLCHSGLRSSALEARALAADGDPVEAVLRLTGPAAVPESLTIAQAADLLDVSAHTLRYYERAGLVAVPRDALGHRVYDADAVRRLVFLTRMRLSGMPMRDLRHYVALVDEGDATVPERLGMLIEHRDTVRRRIRDLTLSLATTEFRIAAYGGEAGPDAIG